MTAQDIKAEIVCPRCKRIAKGWPLHRPDVCSPKEWMNCIREPTVIEAKQSHARRKRGRAARLG